MSSKNWWIFAWSRFFQVIGVLTVVTAALLVVTGLWFKPRWQKEENKTKPRLAFKNLTPPKMTDWHKQTRVKFLLVHGMGHHPLGSDQPGPFSEKEGQPRLAGLANYHGLVGALGYWKDSEHWTSANKKGKPFWEEGSTSKEKEFYQAHQPDYQSTRNQIVTLAAQHNFRKFIEGYCRESGYEIPPQIKDAGRLLSNPNALTPVELDTREPSAGQLPFQVLERDGLALGFLFKLTSSPGPELREAGFLPIDFYVVCWNLSACTVKEEAYGTWDNLGVDVNGRRIAKGTRDGNTSDFDEFIDMHRDSVNRWAKVNFINWALTDAAIYIQPYGYAFEWAIAEAITEVAAELDPVENTKAVLVTESLGSTIALNTMTQMLSNVAQLPAVGSNLEQHRVWLRHAAFPGDKDENVRKMKLANLKKLREWMQNGNPEEVKVAVYMFANQFGLIQAGTKHTPAIQKSILESSMEKLIQDVSNELGTEAKWPNDSALKPRDFVKDCIREKLRQSLPNAGDKSAGPEEVKMAESLAARADMIQPELVSNVESSGIERLGKLVGKRIHIISFHDPNDLLGFPLSGKAGTYMSISNIFVDNGGRGGWNSTLGTLYSNKYDWLSTGMVGVTDPNQAHRGFSENKHVFDIMLNSLERHTTNSKGE